MTIKGGEEFKIEYFLTSIDIAAWNQFFKTYCFKQNVDDDDYGSRHPLALFSKYHASMFEGMTN